MITFTWSVQSLGVVATENGLNNVVDRAYWHYTADDGEGHTAMVYGEQVFGPPDPNNFTPYDQVTEAQVAGWVEEQIGEEQMTRTRERLTQEIDAQINPPFALVVPPWA